MRRAALFIIILTGLLVGGAAAQAQGNLLQDPGFEGQFTGRGRPDLNIPPPWNIWIASGPRTEPWMNLDPFAFPHKAAPEVHSGTNSLNLNKGFGTFTSAVYQQVSVPEGANVQASAWAWVHTCNLAEEAGECASAAESGVFTRVGIDPNGGTNPLDGDVVWSGNIAPHDQWSQMTVDATATAGTVTMFLYVTQVWPADLNNAYWDDASLTIGGAGGVVAGSEPPPPTAPPSVPFVVAQAAQDDGAIVHTVQGGDTLDSIAVAYQVTRADIMALNDITDARFIFPGQRLTIREAASAAETVDSGEDAENTGEASDADASEDVAEDGEAPPSEDNGEDNEAVATAEADEADTDDLSEARSTPQPAPVVSVASGEVQPALNLNEQISAVCVTLFEDVNHNRIQETGETLLPEGQIVLNRDSEAVGEIATDGVSEPYCFSDLAAGEYIAVAKAPSGYGLTTPDRLRLEVRSGTTLNLTFGAAKDVAEVLLPPAVADTGITAVAETAAESESFTDQLLDISGFIVFGLAAAILLGGLGVTLALRQR